MARRAGYLGRLWTAFLGRVDEPTNAVGSRTEPSTGLAARLASLEMDLAERDRQIADMRIEYASLAGAKERAASGAGQEELEKLFKRIAGTLANLTTLAACAESGQEVEVRDLVSLFRGLERELAKAGLEPIGRLGEQTGFDIAAHQRMSGGAVHAGTPVTVQLPGYRMGERVLMKAMVRATE